MARGGKRSTKNKEMYLKQNYQGSHSERINKESWTALSSQGRQWKGRRKGSGTQFSRLNTGYIKSPGTFRCLATVGKNTQKSQGQ